MNLGWTENLIQILDGDLGRSGASMVGRTFGRYRCVKEILKDGEVRSRIARMPRDQWLVEIRDHHEGYLTFEQQLKNLHLIEKNRTNPKEAVLSGPAREGLALLQGLLICGCCGRRLTPRYRGNGGIYPIYDRNWRRREGLSKTSCMSVQCGYLDRAVETRLLDIVNKEQIDTSRAIEMRIRLLPEAERDLEVGADFYASQKGGLGVYFNDCLASDIESLKLYAGIHKKCRGFYRSLSKRFPFSIYYKSPSHNTNRRN